jgi:hypothetical protein
LKTNYDNLREVQANRAASRKNPQAEQLSEKYDPTLPSVSVRDQNIENVKRASLWNAVTRVMRWYMPGTTG